MKILILIGAIAGLIFACPAVSVGNQILARTVQSAEQNPAIIPVTGANSFTGCGGTVIQPINASYEQTIVEMTNQVRRQNHLPPLKRVTSLDSAARYHAADMSANDYFDHNTLHMVNGKLTQTCDPWNRIVQYYTNWQALGENIAAGQDTPQMAMDGWIHSPEHYRNIINPDYEEIGVGFYEGLNDTYRFYWDQDFGRRDNTYPLIIDDEAAKTSSTNADIYVYGKFTEIRLKNDNGTWGAWMKFKNEFSWNLPSSSGTHTVTAEMRGGDQSGTFTSSDTIEVFTK